MFQNIIKNLGIDPNKREIERLSKIVDQINALEKDFEKLSDDELREKTAEFRRELQNGATLDDLLPKAFAAVREAGKRTIGLRHYDIQMIGGMNLHNGKIAEMRTGEGKTLVATLPLYLNALTGRGVHLVTVNDYLARRDARWMGAIFHALGMQVGVLQMASRTDNGKNAFLVDFERTSPHEDQHNLRLVTRDEAYAADITYGTNAEFGFDYLRDNLTMTLEERVQRGHYYAIIDEVDNILIDEARTPLIISGPASDDSEWYLRMAQVVRQLNPEDYEIIERERSISLTEIGEVHVEDILGLPLRDPERPEDITPEQARLLGYLEQAMRAQFLYKRNKDYLVQAGKVVIVDEFTGRLMPGRRWSEGLHQAIEAKENVKVEPENVTYATITLQNYYRMYEKLAGMTGTAATESEEFHKIYKLEVLSIPTNLEYQSFRKDAELVEVNKKDTQGYKYTYYARRDDPERPRYYRRQDYPDVVYRSEEGKLRAITQEMLYYHVKGRPLLVGTTSVEHSERLSNRISAEPLRRLAQTLIIRKVYLDKNNLEMLERAVPELQILNKAINELDPGDLRPLARSLEISLNPEEAQNLEILRRALGLNQEDLPRLVKVLQAGIPHNVLNARKHDEESQIIARAGAYGAVTIATNMAGRGVDIKLGGELPEEIYKDTNRVLGRLDEDPYDLTLADRRDALQALDPEQYGIYEESVKTFLQYMEEMQKVRDLNGLHVIGSERHEARRIDNQLRGRAARQGDPGSSRFYLSLEDDLMRLFGGPQVENLWKRMFFDESLPLEMNLIGRLVEQSQTRVEGSNFDVRKHLLEYDDVLNSQRSRIYSQRDRVFTKDNLSEDILDMLHTELQQRIPQALKDKEGPWKLLAYLDEIQPGFGYEEITQLSFPYRLIREEIFKKAKNGSLSEDELRVALLDICRRALQAEKEHLMHGTHELLDNNAESLENQIKERQDAFDTFLDGLSNIDEENGSALRPQEMTAQLNEAVRLPLRLNPDQLRRLPDGDKQVVEEIRLQIETALTTVFLNRLVGTFERRLEDEIGVRPQQLLNISWTEISQRLVQAVENTFDQRVNKLLGDNGQLAADINAFINRQEELELSDQTVMQMLIMLTQGSRLAFDTKTHRKVNRRVNRINFNFLAAQIIGNSGMAEITEAVLEHLEGSLQKLQLIRGKIEWNRFVQGEVTLQMLEQRVKDRLIDQFGEERFAELAVKALPEFSAEDRQAVIDILGAFLQNELYRYTLLRVISDQWVDYLTRVEALRVSIGLEAYAQRDPLVQYKSRATEMFATLLADI
ncbi:MAG: hypothetical protein LWX83_12390, partial [Anaerolineae bacterium]|nr:hypothetical protein [Anaerolineae bacterium]